MFHVTKNIHKCFNMEWDTSHVTNNNHKHLDME
jgi:hypothetical protein